MPYVRRQLKRLPHVGLAREVLGVLLTRSKASHRSIPVMMAHEKDTPRTRRAAIISRTALSSHQPMITRALAGSLWGVSLVGGLLWAGGGVPPWLALAPNWWGVGAALACQLVCSCVQWVWCHDGWNPYYLLALAVSSTTTALGYWPILHPPLATVIAAQDGAVWHQGGSYIAGTLIVIGAIIADIYPEKVLTN